MTGRRTAFHISSLMKQILNIREASSSACLHRGLLQICDFNLSKAIEESANVMSSLGTTNPRWLAPEILSGKAYTFSSDVYR